MRKLFSSKLVLFALVVGAIALAGGTAAALGAHGRSHQPTAPAPTQASTAVHATIHPAAVRTTKADSGQVATPSDPASTTEQDNEVEGQDDQADQPEANDDDQGDQVEQDDQGDNNDDQGDSNDDQGESDGGGGDG